MFPWIGDGPEDGCDVHNGDGDGDRVGAGGDYDNDAAADSLMPIPTLVPLVPLGPLVLVVLLR